MRATDSHLKVVGEHCDPVQQFVDQYAPFRLLDRFPHPGDVEVPECARHLLETDQQIVPQGFLSFLLDALRQCCLDIGTDTGLLLLEQLFVDPVLVVQV